MRRPGGYVTLTVENKIAYETDCFSCGHCNRVTHVAVKQKAEDLGGLCKQCMKLICAQCAVSGRCLPLEKQLDAWERADRLYRDMRF